MVRIEVAIDKNLNSFLEKQAKTNGFSTPADYVQALLVDLQKRAEDRVALEEKLLEGIRSPKVPGDEAFWRARRKKIYDKHPELDPCSQNIPDAP
jgi:Arc/MetJ-type ribon-helix-helix transcriptional regulator